MVCPCRTHHVRAVALDLHATAAAVALLATPKFPVDRLHVDRDGGRHANQRRYKRLAMRLAGCDEPQHPDRSGGVGLTAGTPFILGCVGCVA